MSSEDDDDDYLMRPLHRPGVAGRRRNFRRLNNPDCMDFSDPQMVRPSEVPIIGVYSATDWARQLFLKTAFEQNIDIFADDATYEVSKLLKANDLIDSLTDAGSFVATDDSTASFASKYSFVNLSIAAGQLSVQIIGTVDEVARLFAELDSKFQRAGASIEWIYNSQGHSVELPLQHREPPEAAYPWLPRNFNNEIKPALRIKASSEIIQPPETE
jgi:hypothetical protein